MAETTRERTLRELREAVVLSERAEMAYLNDDAETAKRALWELWALSSKVFTDLERVIAPEGDKSL